MKLRNLPGLGASLALHLTVGIVLLFMHVTQHAQDLTLAVESLFETERTPEEFTRDLSADTTVSETMNVVEGGGGGGGGVFITAGGGGTPGVSHAKIESSEQFQDPTVVVGTGDVAMPGLDILGTDLGESQVAGETAAVTEGYGPALSRITQELVRMLREDRVLVVWLFDESESMKDDQKDIREQFHKIYEEIGIATERDQKVRTDKEHLLSAVHSFGQGLNALTPKPTADISEIRASITKINVDETGKENTFSALGKLIDHYRPIATKSRRKLVFVIVTDESGDDGQGPLMDEVIFKAQRARAPVYVLGREAVFGFPYARIRWIDPKYGLTHWTSINRGPESAGIETLQWDGLHERWDAYQSGFAPYEQARLAKETGGVFFVLPYEEEHLDGLPEIDRRKYAFLDLKEYTPQLVKRKEYEEERGNSKLRSAISDVVKLLNPHTDPELQIQEIWYTSDPVQFKAAGQRSFDRATRARGLLNQAIALLDKVKPLREKEQSQRWRANYDLIYAQVLAYRVRLFQFQLAMDAHMVDMPKPKNLQHNVWNIVRNPEMLTPTERQIKLTKVDMDEIKRQLDTAKTMFEFVRRTHPATPWALRAEIELRQGFGMRLESGFRDPRYDKFISDGIKVPAL